MTNKDIANLLKLTASLLELHGENQFKIRTYSNAVLNIEKQGDDLFKKSLSELESLDGIGKGLAQSIIEIRQKGTFSVLEELISKTPEGVLEMIELKGIGPKKIKVLWKELNIENMDQLLEACNQGQIAKLKGFGVKTQESIKQHLEYIVSQRGKMLYADVEPYSEKFLERLRRAFPELKIEFTGAMRRKMDIVEAVEIIINSRDPEPIKALIEIDNSVHINSKNSGPFSLKGRFVDVNLKWHIRFSEPSRYQTDLMLSTGSGKHLSRIDCNGKSLCQTLLEKTIDDEKTLYHEIGLPYIAPELREGSFELSYTGDKDPPELLEVEDIKGPFHNHSNYSDGKNTIRQLAVYCIEQGYAYLGLSDHSKSAFYANGLQEFQLIKQHEEIDRLNAEMTPFKIFKGIESDILNDGSLDYEPEVLVSFDFIVASIHSNLNMDKNKATQRLITAVENPFTTFLGHPTGRLLLKRQGYPIDHKKVIDACASNHVIIEINANPWRLDIDWRWVNYALEKDVILSINPDAHELEGFKDMKYGVYAGRKGGLTKEMTFNSWSLEKVEAYLVNRKAGVNL
ncbi:MAG: DNA polymerase/3'-5' exonuclease PolX [Cytophagales bacterium]|nr:DNA polymerase/3'-5' exonuclease PolX [Cytophagales bacterium]